MMGTCVALRIFEGLYVLRFWGGGSMEMGLSTLYFKPLAIHIVWLDLTVLSNNLIMWRKPL